MTTPADAAQAIACPVSVVVPTRDRAVALGRCLAALSRQTVPIELIVVDDGSADAEAVRAAVTRAAPLARLLRGAGEGPAAARNVGVRAATGAVVCFTDDDCAPEPEWAQRLSAACDPAGAAAGTTRADPAAGSAARASQLITHVLTVSSLAGASLVFAPTCNLACAAPLARRLPFDAAFPHAAGEDRDWCARLRQGGAPLRFVAEAVVVHRPRLGIDGLLRQQLRYGRGAMRFRTAAADRRLAGVGFYRRLAREAIRAGPAVAALTVLAQAAVAAGAAQELAVARARSR